MLRTCAGIEIALGWIAALAGIAPAASPFHGAWEAETVERHLEPLSSAVQFAVARARMDMIGGWMRNTFKGRSHVAYRRLERDHDRIPEGAARSLAQPALARTAQRTAQARRLTSGPVPADSPRILSSVSSSVSYQLVAPPSITQ